MTYVKLINKYEVHEPPVNYNGIMNYNLDIPRLIEDGYKELIPVVIPEHINRLFHLEYVENADNIEEIIVYDETQEEADEREAQEERQRLDMLSLTKREVFLALYKDKGITPEQIKAQITNPEALIEFEYASEYFRGNPLIDQIGLMLGYTTDDMDYLFENKEFKNESVV